MSGGLRYRLRLIPTGPRQRADAAERLRAKTPRRVGHGPPRRNVPEMGRGGGADALRKSGGD